MPESDPRAFLSYARNDGEEFATALRQRLADLAPDVIVWQDRSELEGGIGWWSQITAALDRVKFLVIVMTPQALLSEVTRDEWRYARQRGVIVYPVKGVPDGELDYESLPPWMRRAHFFDVGRVTTDGWRDAAEFSTFLNYLRSDREPARIPFMAPELPSHFVPRGSEFEQLLKNVLDRSNHGSVAGPVALQGGGGYGKTTLAIALCHEQVIGETFPDGVLWTTLGRAPDLIGEISRLHDALAGHRPDFIDVAHAATKLAEKLEHRKCLIVVDDVWQRAHLEPFLKGGRECVRLITTRRWDVVSEALRVPVDKMSSAESVRLLTTVLPPGGLSPTLLSSLAYRLGKWPLLLKLAAGMIRKRLDRGDSVDGALKHVIGALDKRGVTAFDQAAAQRQDAVRMTLAASVDELSADDARRFQELAVFPEETAVPLTTVGRLWALDDIDCAECAQRLDDVSLLTLDLRRGAITLHAVTRKYLLTELRELVVGIHRRLIASYGNLRDLPDLYAWRWVPYHLRHADLLDDLRELLLSPDWLTLKARMNGPHALISDFELATGNRDCDMVLAALRLSLPVIAEDSEQMCEQLCGRLPSGFSPRIDSFRSQLHVQAPRPRLHAPRPNLQTPGGGLVQTLSGHSAAVGGAVLLSSNRAVTWSDDGTLRIWNISNGESRGLVGHAGRVAGALVLSDERVLSWGADHAPRLWTISSEQPEVLPGHTRSIRGALLLSPERVVTWSDDCTLRLWDLEQRTAVQLQGHTQWVTGALVLPEGGLLSWSADATLRVWDATGAHRQTLVGHEKEILGAALLSGDRAVSWSVNGEICIWDLKSGERRSLEGHQDSVTSLRIVSNTRALSSSADSTVRAWDLESGRSQKFTAHEDYVAGVLDLPTGEALSWSDDATLRMWNGTGGDEHGVVLRGHTGPVAGATLLADGRVLSWSGDRTVRLWDLATSECRTFEGHEKAVTGVLPLPDGRALSWSDDATLRVWDLARNTERPMVCHKDWITGGALLDEGRALTWSADKTLAVWDLATHDVNVLRGHQDWVTGVLLTPDSGAVSWGSDHTLRVWNLTTLDSRALVGHDAPVTGALTLRNGTVASWSEDRTLRIWDLDKNQSTAVFRHDDAIGGALKLSEDRLLFWGGSEMLYLWNVETGSAVVLRGHLNAVLGAAALGPMKALSWSEDKTLRIWDLAGGTSAVLKGHAALVMGAIPFGNEQALSWSADKTLRTWNLANGSSRVLEGHDDLVHGALLLPRNRAISWSADHALWLWNLESGMGARFSRPDEWATGALLLPDGRLLSSHVRSIRIRSLDGSSQELAFYFDAAPTVVVPEPSGRLLVGDALWRIHILTIIEGTAASAAC